MVANNLIRLYCNDLRALGISHSQASLSRYIKRLAELGLVDASSKSYHVGQDSRPIIPSEMVKINENIRGDVGVACGWYKDYKEGLNKKVAGCVASGTSSAETDGQLESSNNTLSEDEIFACFVEENVPLNKDSSSDITTRILQCHKVFPCKFTTKDIITNTGISKQALYFALKKLMKDGNVCEISGNKKNKEYQWTSRTIPKEDFKYLNKKARYESPVIVKKNENLRGDVVGVGGFIDDGDGDLSYVNNSISDNINIWEMAKKLCHEYPDCWGEKRYIRHIDRDLLRAYCKYLSRPICEPYHSMVEVVNKLYQMELGDRLMTNEINEIFLHFNQNYKGKISGSGKSFVIKRTTRMHHKWAYRNKEKVFIPEGYTANEMIFDKSKSLIYMQDFMARVFGSNYHQYDISSTVPRIVAKLNDIDIPFEGKDCYRLIVDDTCCPYSKWQNVLDNYDENRQVIKKLFMFLYFGYSSDSVFRYTIPSLIMENNEKIARIYDTEKDENVRKERIKLEALNITPEMNSIFIDEESINDFYLAIKKVLGGKIYSAGEVFFVESVIELLTVHHFLIAGHLVVNNFDEFFFGEDLTEELVKQEVYKNFIEVCTMYKGGENPLPECESVRKLAIKALEGSFSYNQMNGR
jgi:hypothetical protein